MRVGLLDERLPRRRDISHFGQGRDPKADRRVFLSRGQRRGFDAGAHAFGNF
jgi:hypothetical protein